MDTNNTTEMEKEFNKLTKKELVHFVVWCFPPESQKEALQNLHSRTREQCMECYDLQDKI